MDEIIGEFLVESYEGLDQMDESLVRLEETPDDIDILKEVFRTLHTIKGTCGFLGFGHLEKVAHAGENLLSLLRDGKRSMSPEITDALLATVDKLREILASVDETQGEGEPDIDQIVATLAVLTADDPAATTEPPAPPSADAVGTFAFDDGASDTTGSDRPDPVEPVAADAATSVDGEPGAEGDTLGYGIDPAPEGDGEGGAPKKPISLGRLGDMLVTAGAVNRTDVEIAAVEQQMGDLRPLGKILVESGLIEQGVIESVMAAQRSKSAGATIRVDVALLDRLMNLVGELVLSRNQIFQLAGERKDHEFVTPAQRLNLITSELQEGVMKTRMQPINNAWARLPRLVRDLSQQMDKRVRIEMVGKDTELDRTIIEAIKDPLTHIVRNTVDHGIELPEKRLAAGKDPEGLLRLRASHEGGQVNIEVSDDGKGIEAEPLRIKAVDSGFVTAENAAKMTDTEIVQLIFKSGLSTAKSVSNVSGRGVGMDVVKTNIERIGGSVDLKTEPGVGTTFKIKIPLTLAIIPALIITCAGNRYAIPQVNLLELVRLERDDPNNRIEDMHGAPVYRLRGRLLPIVDLREQLGAEPVVRATTNIVVLKADDQHFGLIVDAIEDTEEIVVKPMGHQVKDIKIFSGATIMGDGRIALILDLMGIAAGANLLEATVIGHNGNDVDTTPVDSSHALDDRTLLLLGIGPQQVAIPLATVERLEEFPQSAVERSEGRRVVQYRHQIMPLIDLGPMLAFTDSAFEQSDRVSVVVCSFNGRTVGLAVGAILDIVSHAEVLETITEDSQSVVIAERVTDVIDIPALVASVLPITTTPPAAEDQPSPVEAARPSSLSGV